MTYVKYVSANNIKSYLVSAISSSSSAIIVNDWSIFPSSFPYQLTIEQYNSDWIVVVREIATATAKDWNTISITRATESCVSDESANPKVLSQVAHSFNADSVVSLSMTAWMLQDVQEWRTDLDNKITDLNNQNDALSDRIDNIEEDISLLQNL